MRTLLIGALAAVALGGTIHRFETATAAHALHATSTEREAQSAAGPADPDVVAVVERVFSSSEHPGLKWSAIPDAVSILKPLYDAEGDRLMWFERNAPVPGVERALAAIGAAGDHGLDPADYDAASLAEQWTSIKGGSASAPERALFDLGMSVATARLIRSVHMGRVDPRTMQWGYTVVPKKIDVTAVVREVREGKGLARHAGRNAAAGPALCAGAQDAGRVQGAGQGRGAGAGAGRCRRGRPRWSPARRGTACPQLAARLRALGDLTGAPPLPPTPALSMRRRSSQAVKRFQERHGLETDGVIGAGTMRALNVPLAQRVRQIELAMERMRWLPELDDRPNVFVNVPLFRMWATDPHGVEEPLRMNVVVGQSLNHQTPLFVEQLEYVIFRPYWNPPYGITVKEIVPKARRDPGYMARENLEIVASGADNAPALRADAGEPVEGGGGQAVDPAEARTEELARPGEVHLPERRERSTCTARRRSSCSHARAATSATAASGSRTRRACASGCCAISRSGRGPASMRR